jgi:hypothetical protein
MTERIITPESTRTAATTDGSDLALRHVVARLQAASYKLGMAREHWESGDVTSSDIGAVIVVREVDKELDALCCDLEDWAKAAGHDVSFEGIPAFDEASEPTDREVRS